MRYMGRAARMERHHKRHKLGGLNLVSLMDIFTILVFFLLVNSSEVEVLPNAKEVQLPESIAEQRARETVVVLVTPEHLLVQGRAVGDVADDHGEPRDHHPRAQGRAGAADGARDCSRRRARTSRAAR